MCVCVCGGGGGGIEGAGKICLWVETLLFRRVYSTGLQGQVWQKTQVSQCNCFSNILITGNAPVRSRYET